MTDSDTKTAASQRFIRHQRSVRNRNFLKATALILLAVLAGVVIGVGGTLLYFQKKMHRRGTQAIAEKTMERLDSLVSLSPDEKTRVREIVDARMKDVAAMRRRRFGEILEVFRSMDAPMESILGPERAEAWRAYREERFSRRQSEMQSKESAQ